MNILKVVLILSMGLLIGCDRQKPDKPARRGCACQVDTSVQGNQDKN
jgi:hypothetical protein